MSVDIRTTLPGTRPPGAGPLHEVLRELVAAADDGDALRAFLHAAGASQIVADSLQGTVARPRLLAAAATAARGRLGLASWHVLLRDLAVVLAEAVIGSTTEESDAILLSVRTAVEGLRPGMTGQVARLYAGTTLDPPTVFEDHDLRPEDVLVLAERFARRRPDRELPLLVLGLRPSGAYLAPLFAAALGRLDYLHVVTRTTRARGPLLPEERALPEAVRRIGGLVVPISAPPRSGSGLASVAAQLRDVGFATDRIIPVYPSLDDNERPPALLQSYPVVTLPVSEWAGPRSTDGG